MSDDELYGIIHKASKGELMTFLQDISSAKLNELDNVIQKVKVIINLMD